MKSQKELYRKDFCEKPAHQFIDDILLAIAKNKSKFLKSLSSNAERKKLKKAISTIANRFMCLLADKAYYSQKLNAWGEKSPKRGTWNTFQQKYPYFSDKFVDSNNVCKREKLNYKKLATLLVSPHSGWKTVTHHKLFQKLKKEN